MAFDNAGPRGPDRSKFRRSSQSSSNQAPSAEGASARGRAGGSAAQKHNQWLTRAVDAEHSGDLIEAELCRQYAEHWFRVSHETE
ncbi:MAG: DUF4167 domain-containing protein [Azospirillaceae bacterium]|nr:DUF4167 domain-containing protein [Azospirillaceae bacterium]